MPMERKAAKAAMMSDFLPLNIPPCGSGKLTAGIHVTITIVLYFGVKLQVLFDNNIGAVCIGLLVLSPFVFHLIS